jgi:hypothetical protein
MRHFLAFALACAVCAPALAGSPAGTQPKEKDPGQAAGKAAADQAEHFQMKNSPAGDAALARLKTLVGTWNGTTKDGQKGSVTYRTISNGTCVEETLHTPDSVDMVSVYCPDREGVMMTHYCAGNNQPRMRTRDTGDGNRMAFTFVDVTNLTDPKAGHMKSLVMVFEGKDRLTQEWTWASGGKEGTEVFRFERAAS